jgi:hypothetical protein
MGGLHHRPPLYRERRGVTNKKRQPHIKWLPFFRKLLDSIYFSVISTIAC